MNVVTDFLKANEVIVYFAYGQAFFTLGVILSLQSRKHSRLALAHHLKWLAAFSLVHGVYEWGHAFIPIQATYLPPHLLADLETVRTILLVLSFCLLLRFAVLISFPERENYLPLRLIPFGMLLIWLLVVFFTDLLTPHGGMIGLKLPEATDLARLILAFSGAALASFGMFRQAKIVALMGSPGIASYFRWSGAWFAVYAVLAGLVASRGESTLIAVADTPLLSSIPAIPSPVLRSIAAMAIAWGVIRGLAIFQFETDRFIEERNELERYEGVRARILAGVIAAQEEERKRVARELHDDTGQHLSAVIMGLGAAAQSLPRNATKTRALLQDVRDKAVQTLDSVRLVILGLRPALLDDLGLVPALRRTAEDFGKRSSSKIDVHADGADRRLPPQIETVLFRILQEGMNNIARHSLARHAVLQLRQGDAQVSAILEDDGVGFDLAGATAHLETGSGLGLMGMRERAHLLGGAVTVTSKPGAGTRLEVTLPLVKEI